MRTAVLVCVALLATLIGAHAFTDHFSKLDQQRVLAYLAESQGSDGSFGDLRTNRYAAEVHRLLGAAVPNKKKFCKAVSSLLSADSSVEDIHAAVAARDAAGCKAKLSDAHKATAQSALTSADLVAAHSAASIAAIVKDSGVDIATAVDLVAGLAQKDGSYSPSVGEDGTPYHAGLALELLAKHDTEKAKAELVKVQGILELGGFDDHGIDFGGPKHSNPVRNAGAVVRGLAALGKHGPLDISESQVERLAAFFVANKYNRSPEDAYNVLTGLAWCSDNTVFVPLALSLQKDSVSIVTPNGNAAPKAKITLKTITTSSGSVVSSPGAIVSDSISAHTKDLEAGVYSLTFSVEPQQSDRYQASTHTISYKKHTKLSGVDVQVWISQNKDGEKRVEEEKASHPATLSSTISVDKKHFLFVQIDPKGLKPRQVFVRLESKNGKETIFVAKPRKSGEGYITRMEVAAGEFAESVDGVGEYSVSVIIGDALLEHGISWNIGSITLEELAKHTPKTPLHGTLPEIEHTFGIPDRRAPTVISLFFSALVFAPLAAFVVYAMTLGINIQLPSGTGFLWTVVFQAALAGMLAVYGIYWLRLNIFQAMGGAAGVGIVTLFAGNRALVAHSEMKVDKTKKE